MTTQDRAYIETAVAAAHRKLWNAAQRAENTGDNGLSEDLFQIMKELERVQEDLLRGKGLRTRRLGYRA